MTTAERVAFDSSFDCLVQPALRALADKLRAVGSLGDPERSAVLAAADQVLADAIRRKVSRVLLLELNAARVSGSLTAATSEARWDEFIATASSTRFWHDLGGRYPSLTARLEVVVSRRCAAALELATRFARDRNAIGALVGLATPELHAIRIGAGDSHRGGQTVALLELADRTVVYKPRSLAIDAALSRLLDVVAGADKTARIRVPEVVRRADYGWAEFVEHRYCTDDAELAGYYRRLGHWLAIAALTGATDLHAENLIACGPVPVVIDCETLFSPEPPAPATGYGEATDRAAAMLTATVLRSGLLPGRGTALGWRGVDMSAAGALPGQQPTGEVPQIIDAGTDLARLGFGPLAALDSANRPSAEPRLRQFWPDLVAGFDELTDRLHTLDAAGTLDEPLSRFRGVEMRCVLRATENYAELSRMLWHPVSLHDEATATRRAAELLREQGEVSAVAPAEPAVIAAEVGELLDGDVPYFWTRPGTGRLHGPDGTVAGEYGDLVAEARQRWRSADRELERDAVRASLVSAYLNDGWTAEPTPLSRPSPSTDFEATRRRLAAGLVGQLVTRAVRGTDGTATWVAPGRDGTGWSVRALGGDLYSGTTGVAVLLAGYLQESSAGHAEPVDGVAETLQATLHTVRLAQQQRQRYRAGAHRMRPDPPGLYVGLGSEIDGWLRLRGLGAVEDEGVARACELAGLLDEAVEAEPEHDLLVGTAGAVIALLQLFDATGDQRWTELASSFGSRLIDSAVLTDGTARWASPGAPSGLGGFAHGATGIGWALARLADADPQPRRAADFRRVAEAAFAFEEHLYDADRRGWRDLRGISDEVTATAWCHGAVGIGLAAADLLDRRIEDRDRHLAVLRRAAIAVQARAASWNHTVCHGELGCWELLEVAHRHGVQPPEFEPERLTGQLVASIETNGVVTGVGHEAFNPGLFAGAGGIAYQLLRMAPGCELPSLLVPA